MSKKPRSLSQFQQALSSFRKKRGGMLCLLILIILYLSAMFAEFISPYSYKDEDREYSYAPPTKIHFINDEGKFIGPYVYRQVASFDKFHRKIYTEDKSKRYFVRFFSHADRYKLFGILPSNVHLFVVDAPARIYLFGADSRGRDIFSRLIYGARISLSIGLIGVAISFSIGLLVGGIAGYYGGRIDNILMRVCEMFMLVPGFYLMLALRSAVPDNFNSLQVYLSIVVILSFIGWASLARVIRGMSLSLKEREYVLAAKVAGLSDMEIIIKHILPHTFSYSIVSIMLSIPGYILGEAALSLIGLGIQDPIPSWGNMLSAAMGIARIQFAPWILIPGVFIFIAVFCFNAVGDALRDCFDPLLKSENIQAK